MSRAVAPGARAVPGIGAAAVLAAMLALASPLAGAQAPLPACPPVAELRNVHLFGLWRAEIDGQHAGTLLLEQHREYAMSFGGMLNRAGERSMVAGDIEDGEFTLEESADGKRIAAAWLGDVEPASCGREIRGTWTPDGKQQGRAFILRKM